MSKLLANRLLLKIKNGTISDEEIKNAPNYEINILYDSNIILEVDLLKCACLFGNIDLVKKFDFKKFKSDITEFVRTMHLQKEMYNYFLLNGINDNRKNLGDFDDEYYDPLEEIASNTADCRGSLLLDYKKHILNLKLEDLNKLYKKTTIIRQIVQVCDDEDFFQKLLEKGIDIFLKSEDNENILNLNFKSQKIKNLLISHSIKIKQFDKIPEEYFPFVDLFNDHKKFDII